MGRIINAIAQINIDVPTACGRVQQNCHSFSRTLPFIDQRQKNPQGYNPDLEAYPEHCTWFHQNTRLAPAVDGLMLQEHILPVDMVTGDWTGVFLTQNAVSTGFPIDMLGRQHFFMTAADTTTNQTLTGLEGHSSGVGSAGAVSYTSYQKAAFISNYTLQAGQGFCYEETRLGFNGLNLDTLENNLLTFGPNNTPKPANIIYPAGIGQPTQYISQQYTAIYWGCNSSSSVVWGLVIPFPQGKYGAFLMKSLDNGISWRILDRYPARSHTTMDEKHKLTNSIHSFVGVRVESGTLVIQFSDDREMWRFRDVEDPNGAFVSPAGNVCVVWAGGVGNWILNPVGYLAPQKGIYGQAWAGPFALPNFINSDYADCSIKILPSNVSTPDITVTGLITATPTYYANVIFVPTDSGTVKAGNVVSPVVLGVQEIRRAKIEKISSSKGDMANDAYAIHWSINKRLRGNTFSVTAKNETAQWSFLKGNEYVTLKLATVLGNDDGTTTTNTLTQVMAGFITKRKLTKSADQFPGTPGIIEITCKDWEFRLNKKKMRDRPPYGGWWLEDAIDNVLNHCGVDPSFYDLSAIDTHIYLLGNNYDTNTGRGANLFKYSDRQSVIHALDEMLAAFGFIWYSDLDGKIKVKQVNSYDTTNTYVLNDDTYNPDTDCITQIDVEKDLEHFYNVATVYSRQSDGTVRMARLYDPNSIYGNYATTPNYVGDDWWDTFDAEAGIDPNSMANVRLSSLAAYDELIVWETDLRTDLKAGQKISVSISSLNTQASYIVEEIRGTAEQSEEGYSGRCTYIMGIPKTGT